MSGETDDRRAAAAAAKGVSIIATVTTVIQAASLVVVAGKALVRVVRGGAPNVKAADPIGSTAPL